MKRTPTLFGLSVPLCLQSFLRRPLQTTLANCLLHLQTATVPCKLLLLLLLPLLLAAQKKQTAEIRVLDGTPTLFVNEQPELPFWYALTHVSGGRWSWEELPAHNLRNACADGIRVFQVDLWLADIWSAGEKPLDMALARRQLRGVLDACAEAAIVLRLHVNAPMWWNRAHPDECTQFADGPLEEFPEGLPFNHEDGDIYRSRRASLASEKWRAAAGERVREFCRRLQHTAEGRAVVGLHLAGGVYGEWHPWGFFRYEPDVSAPMQQAFRHWLRAKYGSDQALQAAWNDPAAALSSATVPDTNARRCCADGFFRDPSREQAVLDFYQCQQDVIATDIEFFCRLVKTNWKRPLITGVFYGYFHFALCRQAMGGHLEIERLLDSPWIDYFAGPPSYNRPSRVAGGSGLQRSLVQSVLQHGKMWFDEVDNGYLQNKREKDFVRSSPLGDSSYLTVFRRSLWLPLMQGCGLWLYDFGPQRSAGWWDGEMYRQEIRRTRSFFSRPLAQQAAADALVVWDTRSFYQVENINSKTCEQGLDAAAEEWQRCGVAFDQAYLFDLPNLDLRPYKAVVFMNAWQLDAAQRRFIRDSVARDGRTLIWNYLSGYSDGRRTALEQVEEIVGLSLEKISLPDTLRWRWGTEEEVWTPERVSPLLVAADTAAEGLATLSGTNRVLLARKKMPAYVSVYAGAPLHKSAVFRRLLREAGCRVRQEKNDVLFSAGGYLLLHSTEPGARRLVLDNGTEVLLQLTGPATLLIDAKTGALVLP
ncbi:MAG: hypothetical protein IT260_21625 [Saprospiraceae bacterium]|nr:hypothetical protein [Saprospiraceae bacterium]